MIGSKSRPWEELQRLRATRSTRRQQRARQGVQCIGLVGYTNVGKSAIVNRLAGSELAVKDSSPGISCG